MSCHDIGRGMNSVVLVVLDLYDHGKMSLESARQVIKACREGTQWCDGNENEAVMCCCENRCGYCLERLKPGDALYCLYDIVRVAESEGLLKDYEPVKVFRNRTDQAYKLAGKDLGYDWICANCFEKIINKITGDSEKTGFLKQLVESISLNEWHVAANNMSDYYMAKYMEQKEKDDEAD